jgi:hypothetical protein
MAPTTLLLAPEAAAPVAGAPSATVASVTGALSATVASVTGAPAPADGPAPADAPPPLPPPPPGAPPPAPVVRCVALNAADRDTLSSPRRYEFDVPVGAGMAGARGSLSGSYRDVAWVEATRIIIPLEVAREDALAAGGVAKPLYMHDVSLGAQYVILRIPELEGTYDGTSAPLQRAFALFVYDRQYSAPNGRGYALLEPAQDDAKRMLSMASIARLRVRIERPNGALIANSADGNALVGVAYEPAVNRLFVRVLMRDFFDSNEFMVGDSVLFKGFRVEAPASPAPSATTLRSIAQLVGYINRPEGHEVVALGPSESVDDFRKSVYILAPGMLDQNTGVVQVDANCIQLIQDVFAAAPGAPVVSEPGAVVNASAQPVVMLRIGIAEDSRSR